MKKITKKELTTIWNEAEEINQDLELSKNDLLKCIDTMKERINKILEISGKYVSNKDVQKYIEL